MLKAWQLITPEVIVNKPDGPLFPYCVFNILKHVLHWLQSPEMVPTTKEAQGHLLKVRQLITPEMMANEPDEDQTEAFLAAAERGESAKIRKV